MSDRLNAPALSSRRTSVPKPVRRLDSSGNLRPAAPARLGRRESTTDFDFVDPQAESGARLYATPPRITIVDSNSNSNSTTTTTTTAASTTASTTYTTSTGAAPAAEPGPATMRMAPDRPATAVSSPASPATPAWTASPRRTNLWQERAQFLLANADQLRGQFEATRKATTPKIQKPTRKVVYSERALCQLVDGLLCAGRATCIHFDWVTRTFSLSTVLARARDVPIKLDASGIGRERFLQEVLPAVAKIHTRCPVVLVARQNRLRPGDVQALVEIMKRNAVVYHLDLSDNPLCRDEEPCLPLVELFRIVGPTSHVYLVNCGVNDETARRIADALPANPCIIHLDLRRNEIDQTGVVRLAQAAARTSSLAALRLQGNEFDEGDEDVMHAVAAANQLKSTQSDTDNEIISLPLVQTRAVDADTMLNVSMCALVQQLLDAAASREQL